MWMNVIGLQKHATSNLTKSWRKRGTKLKSLQSFSNARLVCNNCFIASLSRTTQRHNGLIALTICHNSLYIINWQLRIWRGYGIKRLINEWYLFSCTIFLAFSVLTRKTINLNVSLSLQFEASLYYFWGFNLIVTREMFFSDCIGGDVSTLVRISTSPTARKRPDKLKL